jgi:hypothetical protein
LLLLFLFILASPSVGELKSPAVPVTGPDDPELSGITGNRVNTIL